MTLSQLREKTHSALAQGDIDEALMLLVSYLRGNHSPKQYDSALMIKAKWETIKRDHLNGTISRAEYELALAKTIAGIQSISNELAPNSNFKKYQEPVEARNVFKSNKMIWAITAIVLTISLISIYRFVSKSDGNQQITSTNGKTSEVESKEEPNKKDNYDRLVKQARSLFDKGAYKMALDTINAALSINVADITEAIALKNKCNSAFQAPLPKTPSDNSKKLIDAAIAAFERGDIDNAIENFSKVGSKAGDWFTVCRKIKEQRGTYIIRPVNKGERIPSNIMRFYAPGGNDFTNPKDYSNVRANTYMPKGSILTWENIPNN